MSDFNRLIGKLKKQKASFQKLLDVTLPKKSGMRPSTTSGRISVTAGGMTTV